MSNNAFDRLKTLLDEGKIAQHSYGFSEIWIEPIL